MKIRKTVMGAALLALVAVLAVVAAGVVVPGGAEPAQAADPVVLTVNGNGQTKRFTMAEVKALPAYTGYSGFVNSAGTVFAPEPVKGVKVADLLNAVGGMSTLHACDVTAKDDYGMTYTYDQMVNGNGVQLYNIDGKTEEAPKTPLSFVLIYEQDGSPLGEDGPLRLVVAQQTDVNQIADGHLYVKWVDRVTLRGAVKEWKVKMYGLKKKGKKRQTYTLDRTSYDSCAAPGCHGSSWVDPAKKKWSGVPLFLCIGKVDGGPGHDSYKAYNDRLARKGYRIKLIAANGKYRIITSRASMYRENMILANKLMGSDLTKKYYPLRLVGPKKYVPSSKAIGQIKKIVLLPK